MLPLPLSQIFQPSLTELGRLPSRATLEAYPNETALKSKGSPWRLSLDGVWRFQLVSSPEQAPEDWIRSDTQNAPWREIDVPGVWTRQDTGDLPHYANWRMPFDCPKPPQVPDENPTGLYRTEFEVPAKWQGRSLVLHLGGFESAVLVWCNGHFIGLGKDSRLPSEFDLTPALKDGKNALAIMVPRWCDATWIEDQDHWNHGGLHRSVFIEARAETHIQDLIIDTDFDPDTHRGKATIKVNVAGESDAHSVRVRLEDAKSQYKLQSIEAPIAQFDTEAPAAAQWAASYGFESYAAKLDFDLKDVQPWSAERPTRYRLVTSLLDPNKKVLEVHETWIGFTRIEVAERRLRINGSPIVLIGVNRHDHHPENGKTCSAEDIRAELITMKRHNINAIRTAHYPNDPALLDLADELGFYVIDEANVECHARWSHVAHHPGYQAAIIERTVRMIARDRNHPCIIGWSLGNEAGHGPAHDAAAAIARNLDPSRFIHYEGAVSKRFSFPFANAPETTQRAPSEAERAATDLLCPMYTPVDDVSDWAIWAEATKRDNRPLILCEFSHAMGNSNGSISEYVDAFFNQPALAGGFVWDWRDQGLAETDEHGQFYWAYGGHFGDTPNDANFNINGLVGPDGAPHPALREYMWAARPVIATLNEDGQVVLENRRHFRSTADLKMHWVLLRNGERVEEGSLRPVVAPGESLTLDPFLSAATDQSADWHLTLNWSLREDTHWAKKGHIVAWDQLILDRVSETTPPSLQHGSTQTPPFQAQSVGIGDLSVRFDAQGGIDAISMGGEPILASPITPCLWRAPTDNDGGKPGARPLFPNRTGDWVAYGIADLQPSTSTCEAWAAPGGTIQAIERIWNGGDGESLTHKTRVQFSEDEIVFDETIIVPEAWKDLPRVGVRFEVAEEFKRLYWRGLGPDESYPDRKGAQTHGVWESSIDAQYHPFVRPQEHGAHEDTHWFRLLNEDGTGIQVSLSAPLSFTARPHHDVDLNEAETLAELQRRGTTEVHIDAAIRGLGTAACGADTRERFRVNPGTFQFRWQISRMDADAN